MAKRKPQMIYVLERVTGSYENTCYVPIMAFRKLKDAEAERDRLQKETDELYIKYGEKILHIDDVEAKIFKVYLKDANPKLFKKVMESESSYDYDSDEYQDAFIEFESERKADEYLDKSNLTNEEIECYTVCKKMEEQYGWEKPFYLVSRNPIELR